MAHLFSDASSSLLHLLNDAQRSSALGQELARSHLGQQPQQLVQQLLPHFCPMPQCCVSTSLVKSKLAVRHDLEVKLCAQVSS